MSLANYYFIPTVREGLAAYIASAPGRERAQITARVIPWDGAIVREMPEDTKSVALFGPGDVLGFDASAIVRTDPLVNVWDFEPNYMPLVEFSEPDLPWRFTPTVAENSTTSGKLMPWLTLVVLADGEFSGLGERLSGDEQSEPSDDAKKGPLPL